MSSGARQVLLGTVNRVRLCVVSSKSHGDIYISQVQIQGMFPDASLIMCSMNNFVVRGTEDNFGTDFEDIHNMLT